MTRRVASTIRDEGPSRARQAARARTAAAALSIRLHVHSGARQRSRRRPPMRSPVGLGQRRTDVRARRAQARPGHRRQPRAAAPAAADLLVIAALVKLTSPGPVFFRQERVGETRQAVHGC